MSTDESVKARVPDEEFVRAYLLWSCNEATAEQLGLSPLSVAARANRLRKIGVMLPKYARKVTERQEVDVEGLNAIIANK